MIIYILEGTVDADDEHGDFPYCILGVYDSTDKADEAKPYFIEGGWNNFTVTPWKLNAIPE